MTQLHTGVPPAHVVHNLCLAVTHLCSAIKNEESRCSLKLYKGVHVTGSCSICICRVNCNVKLILANYANMIVLYKNIFI